jgi:hypothetical protein
MNIFTLINSLFFSKKHIDLNSDDESQFNAYMINRWMSMYSIDMVDIINSTSNRYAHVFGTKQDQYNWFYNLFPRVRFKKISYIKKKKEETKSNNKAEDLTSLIAKNHEISEREVRMYQDLFGS